MKGFSSTRNKPNTRLWPLPPRKLAANTGKLPTTLPVHDNSALKTAVG